MSTPDLYRAVNEHACRHAGTRTHIHTHTYTHTHTDSIRSLIQFTFPLKSIRQ